MNIKFNNKNIATAIKSWPARHINPNKLFAAATMTASQTGHCAFRRRPQRYCWYCV